MADPVDPVVTDDAAAAGVAATAAAAKPAEKEKPKKDPPPEPKNATIILEYNVRFDYEYPAFSVEYVTSNPNVVVKDFQYTPFGAKFSFRNLTMVDQMINGKGAEQEEMFTIFGRVLHPGQEGSVEKQIDAFGGSEDTVEFSSDWLQDRDSADAIATWVQSRMSKPKDSISVTLVGTPLIEIGDIITIRHSELSLTANKRFTVTKLSVSWKEGLETSLDAVEI